MMMLSSPVAHGTRGAGRSWVAALAGIILIALVVLTGCTASAPDSAPASDAVFRVGATGGGSTETLNPGKMDSPASAMRCAQLFEPLVKLDSDGELQYWLAESLTPNADGTVYTLKLRPDVTWHDGSPFVVDDVMYTIVTNTELRTWGSSMFGNVDQPNMKKIDDLTLEIPLKRPDFTFPESLVDTNELIYKDGTTDFTSPIGTGPFMFESFTPGQQSVFTRYDDYWGGAAKVAAVEITSFADPTARVNALQSGQVDAILSVPFSSVATLESAGITVTNQPTGNWFGIRFNTQMAPFDDARVREAMALLMDREQIVNNAFGGNAQVANDLWGWFDPAFAADVPQRTYDPERARELLAEAGYPDGMTIDLQTLPTDPFQSIVTLFAASAAAGGVTINVKQMEAGAYYAIPQDEKQWTPTNWDSTPIISQMTAVMSPTSVEDGNSETRWDDPTFFSAYEAVTTTSDPDDRQAKLIEAQEVMHDGVPYIIPAFYNSVDAHTTNVSGLKEAVGGRLGGYDFSSVTVDQ